MNNYNYYTHGLQPVDYARKLLKDMNIKSHDVDEYKVLDFLGYEVKVVDPATFDIYDDRLVNIFTNVCSVLLPSKNLVLVSPFISPSRKRFSLFHEAGHAVLPWHSEIYYFTDHEDISDLETIKDPTRKLVEEEASKAAAELMYPLEYFIEDMRSRPIGFKAINDLALRYRGSLEATAIRYTSVSSDPMAFLVVRERTSSGVSSNQISTKAMNTPTLFDLPDSVSPNELDAPLEVQYCCRSSAFQKEIKRYIPPSTPINQNNLIYKCWESKSDQDGNICASTFGSSRSFKYCAECRPLGNKVAVLIWLPNKQKEFDFQRNCSV